jgi:ABC-2 type transport system ATP-binding protein
MTDAIHAEGVVKSFAATRALDGLSLTVRTGEVHGFLGPNGAGKSTTIRVLLGMLRTDSGAVQLLGSDPWRQAAELHRRLAYVPGDVALWPNLSGGETIDVIGRLRGGINKKRKADLIERFDFDPRKRVDAYSKGNRQKVVLVSAFSSDAELLLLDEPTSGLDPLMEEIFQQCIAEEKQAGRTVLLSSHILSEVEALCDRVSIIRNGRIIETGTLAGMRHLSRTSVSAELRSAPGGLADMPGVHDLEVDGTKVRCQVDPEDINDVLNYLTGIGVKDIECRPPTLEELFLRHYEKDCVPYACGLTSRLAVSGRDEGLARCRPADPCRHSD